LIRGRTKISSVIVRVRGGLGNQLFIYAFARSLALNLKCSVYLETRTGFVRDEYKRKYLLDNFNIQLKKCPWYYSIHYPLRNRLKIFTRLIFGDAIYLDEIEFKSNPELSLGKIKRSNKTFMDGYWQDASYFTNCKDILRNDLSLRIAAGPSDKTVVAAMKLNNSVAIHLRRVQYNTILGLDYYLQAVYQIKEQVKDPVFYIFSDDIEWCKQNFIIEGSFFFMDNNTNNEIIDFWMMSQCKHFIIANSTYSWWGAWMADYPEKIILKPEMQNIIE
jgi:hypothetical protein